MDRRLWIPGWPFRPPGMTGVVQPADVAEHQSSDKPPPGSPIREALGQLSYRMPEIREPIGLPRPVQASQPVEASKSPLFPVRMSFIAPVLW